MKLVFLLCSIYFRSCLGIASTEIQCNTNSVVITLSKAYLDGLGDSLSSAVALVTETTDFDNLFGETPTTDPCNVPLNDAGDHYLLTLNNLDDCVYGTSQESTTITENYRAVVVFARTNVITRTPRHYFLLTCVYARDYTVASNVVPFAPNFAFSTTMTADFAFTIELFTDPAFSQPVSATGPSFSVTDRVYVKLSSGNSFIVKPVSCVSSLMNTLGSDPNEVTLIQNACTANSSIATVTKSMATEFEFSFLPSLTAGTPAANQDKSVVCEVEICNSNEIATCNDDCNTRKKRSTFLGRLIRSTVLHASSSFRVRAPNDEQSNPDDDVTDQSEGVASHGDDAISVQSADRLSIKTSALVAETPQRTTDTVAEPKITAIPPAKEEIAISSIFAAPAKTNSASGSKSTTIQARDSAETTAPKKQQSSDKKSPILRLLDNLGHQSNHKYQPESDHRPVAITYNTSLSKVVYYLAMGLVGVMVVLVLVLLYQKCHRKKVAKVSDEDWSQN